MSNPLQNTPEWLAWRRGGIGASELPAILGMDKYRSEYTLALQKRGELELRENEAQAWGHRVQGVALDAYSEREGVKVRHIRTTVVSRRYPHVYASLDGRVGRKGVEVKLTRERWDDGPPPRVTIQCQAQMGVVGLDTVDVVKVATHWQAPEVYTVERNDIAIAELLPMGEEWYLRYVLGDELPPVDGSRAASDRLNAITGPPEMVADGDQIALAIRLHALRQAQKQAEADERVVANLLKDSMHGAEVLVGKGVRVSWRQGKDRTTTNWEGLASAYRQLLEAWDDPDNPTDLDALQGLHTATEPGYRPVRVTLTEEGWE